MPSLAGRASSRTLDSAKKSPSITVASSVKTLRSCKRGFRVWSTTAGMLQMQAPQENELGQNVWTLWINFSWKSWLWIVVFPCWPDVILSKFHESTEEHKTLLKMKTAFEREFQVSQRNANANTNRVTSSTQGNRCSGVCDYTVDGGKEPLDVQRVIDLPHVGLESFESDNRPGLIFWELIF